MKKELVKNLATCFGLGDMPKAPGTFGTLVVAVYVSDICEREIYHQKDPQNVVIDEVLGFLTTLFLINPVGVFQTLAAIGLAFVIFRIFDITKPGPIYKSQFLGNGVGVVIDDFLAGIIGNFLLVCIWSVLM